MSPLATSPAPTFLTAPTSAVVTVADLLPRESAAPVLSAVATFTCSPSAALHDVAVLVPLFVLSMLVVVLTIVNVVVLYFGCRNGRQPERREVMQKVDGKLLLGQIGCCLPHARSREPFALGQCLFAKIGLYAGAVPRIAAGPDCPEFTAAEVFATQHPRF